MTYAITAAGLGVRVRKALPWGVAAVLSFAAAFAGVRAGLRARLARVEQNNVQAGRATYTRLDSLRSGGRQLLFVYIGSARCRWCRSPELAPHLRTVRDSLARAAARRGHRLVTLGIAVDLRADEGLRHLHSIGGFDQVSAGVGWMNELAVSWVWQRYGLPAATPQLLVVARDVSEVGGDGGPAMYDIRAEQLLVRKVGLKQIGAWATGGVPVPITEHVASTSSTRSDGGRGVRDE